jgi:hypothetical protein
MTVGIQFALSYFGSFGNVFSDNDFISLVGLLTSLLAPPFFGLFLLVNRKRNGNLDLFYQFLFFTGLLIASVNIVMFVLLYYGDYQNIFNYTEFIGVGNYIEDLGSLFVRPSGYFYDYHSQYFIPMIGLFLVVTNKVKLKTFARIIVILIFISSIFLSGVKTAYLTLLACFTYFLFKRLSLFQLFLYSVAILLLAIIGDFIFDSMIYDLGYKIITHDINIFIDHLTEVPVLLINNYQFVFLFGGQVDFANYVYSEVYYVTMIYYIGFLGVFIFYIFPIFYLFVKSNDSMTTIMTIIFSLSLFHYYVFRISFNVVGSALFYIYFFHKFLYRSKVCCKSACQL